MASGANLLPDTPHGDLEARPPTFSSRADEQMGSAARGGGSRACGGSIARRPLAAAAPARRSSAGKPGRRGGGRGRGCGRSARSSGGAWLQQQPGSDGLVPPAGRARRCRVGASPPRGGGGGSGRLAPGCRTSSWKLSGCGGQPNVFKTPVA